ncbi:MAG: ABC transporter substrate-binding protein [Nitrososphaerota archaeon]
MKRSIILLVTILVITALIVSFLIVGRSNVKEYENVRIAVEFNNHAAPAYIAKHFDWFREAGLNTTTFNSYVTGVALANALARGDVDAAYICLGPALLAYARGVDVVIVSGTHLHGYAIISRQDIASPKDLEGRKVGVVEAGSNADIVFQLTVEKYGLDIGKIDVRRGNPPILTTLLWTGQVDAIVVPEHWATIASSKKEFHVLLKSQDVWDNMQGSVLMVKRELLEKKPEVVEKLVKITEKGVKFIRENRDEAAKIMLEELSKASPLGVEPKLVEEVSDVLSPSIMLDSMGKLDYSTRVDLNAVKQYVEILYRVGYIESKIDVDKIVDLRFVSGG